ncbi:hypothetical protein K502DRAFT_190280 [Neoconidiobolus thromboides FSU 785]|nr:hypothetical protein K502DRAFT_190280 [Neoconidiobolus thromboides FSU 785]
MKTLSERPLDSVYFYYFLIHSIFTVIFDCVPIYPAIMQPQFLVQFNQFQVNLFKDPYMSIYNHGYNNNYNATYFQLFWFRTFVYIELFLHLPFFIYSMYQLYHDRKYKLRLYGIIYSSSVMTSVLPMLVSFLYGFPNLLSSYRYSLFMLYFPFFFIPLILLIDLSTLKFSKLKKLQ